LQKFFQDETAAGQTAGKHLLSSATSAGRSLWVFCQPSPQKNRRTWLSQKLRQQNPETDTDEHHPPHNLHAFAQHRPQTTADADGQQRHA